MRSPEQKFEAMVPPSESSEKPEKPEEKKETQRSPEEPYIMIGEKAVSYLGVEVPKGEGGRLVPKAEEFREEYFYLEGHYTTMREVATALLLNKPILLEGGTGVYNKTTTIARMCRDLNMNYCKVNFGRELSPYDVVGDKEIEIDEKGNEKFIWHDGPLLYAIRNGGVAFLDEYNRQSKLAEVINPVIDAILNGRKEVNNPFNKGEMITVHPNFRLIAAQNPPGFEEGHEYTDRSQLPAETFGRWLYKKLPIEYSEAEQNKLLAGVIGEKVDVQLPESEFRHIGEGLPVRELAEIPGMTHWRENIVDITRVLEAKSSGAKRAMAKNQRQNLYFNPRLIMSTVPQYIAKFYRGDINETVKNAFETCVIGMYSSETDKQKIRLMLDQASWKPQAVESKRKGPEREAKEQPKTKEKEKEKTETKEPSPETRLEGKEVSEKITAYLERLLAEGVDKHYVALCLSGVGTPEAMTFREKLLAEGADKNNVALGLSGVGTPEAMTFREKLLAEGADKNSVAWGLAGVNSEEAFKFRKERLSDPTLQARSFETGWSATDGVICRYGYEGDLPKEETKEPSPETRLEGTVAEQIETAIEKLGRENVFGPKEVEKTFSVRLREVPEIPFSVEELERAEEMGQMLVLRVDRTDDGKPMSLSAMNDILAERWKKEEKGGLLNTADGWRDAIMVEKDFVEAAPRSGWALVSKDLLPDSVSKNYIDQTDVIIKALREKAFKDIEMPEEYEKAIQEFESHKNRLTRLMRENWGQAVKELSELSINQLTRQSIQETIYDLAMYYDTRGKHLLPNRYTWSNSRSRDGSLVVLGAFGAEGVYGRAWRPAYPYGGVGVSLSRRL